MYVFASALDTRAHTYAHTREMREAQALPLSSPSLSLGCRPKARPPSITRGRRTEEPPSASGEGRKPSLARWLANLRPPAGNPNTKTTEKSLLLLSPHARYPDQPASASRQPTSPFVGPAAFRRGLNLPKKAGGERTGESLNEQRRRRIEKETPFFPSQRFAPFRGVGSMGCKRGIAVEDGGGSA